MVKMGIYINILMLIVFITFMLSVDYLTNLHKWLCMNFSDWKWAHWVYELSMSFMETSLKVYVKFTYPL